MDSHCRTLIYSMTTGIHGIQDYLKAPDSLSCDYSHLHKGLKLQPLLFLFIRSFNSPREFYLQRLSMSPGSPAALPGQ